HDVKTEIMHQISHTHRHDDWLIGGYPPQRAPVEMIEMSVCNQDEINRRQMMNFETWLLEALDYLEPLRPVWIDQHIDFVGLNKKRRVANPGNTNFAFANFWKLRRTRRFVTRSFNEKGRNQDAGKKIALMPVGSRTQSYSRGTLGSGTVPGLANNVSSALFWETNWHDVQTI